MPALSSTADEAVLAKWLVQPGDEVEKGQPIAEVETDKATMEIEATVDGSIGKILVEAGPDPIKVNTPIVNILGKGESPEETTPSAPAKGTREKDIPAGEKAREQVRGGDVTSRGRVQSSAQEIEGKRIRSSPLARLIAHENDIDLSGIDGTGPYGRILKRDVIAAIDTAPGNARIARQDTSPEPFEASELRPHSNMRRTIARRLTDSFRDIPHFSLTLECEVDRLLELKKRLPGDLNDTGALNAAIKVPTVNDFFVRAVALALKKVPEMNVSYSEEGLWVHRHADIAVAITLLDGLMTPIIKRAETKSLGTLAAEASQLFARAKEGTLKPENYSGGTFTISNLGMYGIQSFNSIINPPHAGILSIGAAQSKLVARGTEKAREHIEVQMISLTLTCDHRAVDGVTGANFLNTVKSLIEQPMNLLL
jgi:pyruvate dehydrogenase E2 component (dihydrolipoamide acetyltransferase)